ncbi:MAG: aminopeptidase P family protein [Chloroflexi bacterium]|nr:MAG: aminopeptidase P family protein [Chloroflexota bacterium]
MTQNQADFQKRLTNLRQQFSAWKIEALLVTNATNRRWLSGFTGSAGKLLITPEKAWLATDSRYWEQAQQEAPHFTLYKDFRRFTDTAEFIRQAGVTRVGLEAQDITLAVARSLHQIEEIEWIPLDAPIDPLRQIKTEWELEKICQAAAIADEAMARVPQLAKVGMTEEALAWELEKFMREHGAESVAFPIIVASGPNSARPHHRPGKRPLQPGDVLLVDLGAQVDGYKSDMTRTFFVAYMPEGPISEVYELVLSAVTAVLDNLKPGLTGAEADALARTLIDVSGYGEYFGHGLGHGVGLDIHEGPGLNSRAQKEQLAAGAVVTVEPGIYLPGVGGVRIEDLVLLTDSGCKLLSQFPKEAQIVG